MVVDACVWIAAFLPRDAHHPPALELVKQLERRRLQVTLPTLALAETCGAIARRSDSLEVAPPILQFVLAQPWIEHIAIDAALGREAASLAMRCRLRGVDAVYVALATTRGLPLITLDQEIFERAPPQVECMTPADWLQRNP